MNSDAFSVRAVISIVGAVVLMCFGTVCWMALQNHKVDAVVLTAGLTALALLCPSPLTKAKTTDAQPVNVVNTAADPIPVDAKHVAPSPLLPAPQPPVQPLSSDL